MSNHELNWKQILSILNKSKEDCDDITSLIDDKVKEIINNHITESNCYLYGFKTEKINNINDKISLLDNNRLLMIFIYQNDIYRNYNQNSIHNEEFNLKNLNQFDYLINKFSEPVIEENKDFQEFKDKNKITYINIRHIINNYNGKKLDNTNNVPEKNRDIYIREFIEKQNTLFEQNIEHLNKYQRENENFKIYELSNKFIFNLLNIGSKINLIPFLDALINNKLIEKFLKILENESQEFINDKILNSFFFPINEIVKFIKDYKENNVTLESVSATKKENSK